MKLQNFDVDIFLRDYWQKRPLLVRGAWDGWVNPIAPDDLAALACDDDVESRLITQKRADWRVEQGPLPEDRFGRLGRMPYTLLVQAVNLYVPEVAALIAPFRFVPDWRIDDVMVSYASDGGGVGPHFDQYDVFLIQGLGQRRWQVGGHGADACTDATPLLPHDDLRLLADFRPVEEWVLEPGDMLYVPPRVAHNGVAVGTDCMTYSIGFRAPARSELIAHFCDHILAELDDDDRYADPDLKAAADPRAIEAAALDRLHAMVLDKLGDRDAFARWFAGYVTTPKYDDGSESGDDDANPDDPATRAAYIRDSYGARIDFVNGRRVGED